MRRRSYRTPVPTISSSKGTTKQLSFKDGVNTYKDNDDLKQTELSAAIDARFVKIGRYKTRRGLDRYSVPIGEAVDVQQAVVTGGSSQVFSGSQAAAQPLTITTDKRLTKLELRLRTTDSSRGVILVEIRKDNGGLPGALITHSTIGSAEVTDTYGYKTCYFVDAPLISASDIIHIVVKGQSANVGDYEISSTTVGTAGLTSTDGGTSWTPANVDFNVKLYTADNLPVKGFLRVYRPNGQKITVFAAGDSVYQVDDTTGATTVVKGGLNASATHYRFKMIQDAVYWVNGLEKPYKWDFTKVEEITAAPFIPDEIEEHVGLLFISDSTDKSKFAWSNFGEYDKWTSTDFQYAPAPKSADGINAFGKLNGILYLFARRNKFQWMGQDNATFQLDEAASQRGTFTQESLVYDSNFIYHADDEGIWMFNGSEERNLAEPFLEDYLAIPNKNTIQLDVSMNRLYVFHAPAGSADNSRCFVINLLLSKYESLDKNTYIGRSFGRGSQDDQFLQASNRVAAIYYAEASSNGYHNLGAQLEYELDTAYTHFDEPAALKRAPKWRPNFGAVIGDYSVQAGYAKDMEPDATWFDIPLSGGNYRYDEGHRYDTGLRYSTPGNIEPKNLYVSGEFKRLQRRYKHVAAREPVEFDSEMLSVQVQRVI